MAHVYSLTAASLLLSTGLLAQPSFTNGSVGLSHNANSGGCMAVVDMDKDGLDDIVQLSMSTHVYILYQNPDHSFVTYDYGEVDNDSQWGWAIADIDGDGHKDITSGVSITRYLRISARGVYTLDDLNGPTIFTQGMSLADLNNDGRIDVYACNDVGPNNIWITDASGTPIYDGNFIDWSVTCTGLVDPDDDDMSGNYGSTFTDFDDDGDIDLHISHCRQGVNDPDDCRRWDRLFVNDGSGNYTDLADAYNMQNQEQVWTTDFGDYDNDGDLDAFSTTHSSTLMLFENDGTGHYTDVTAGSNLENYTGFFLQGLFRDMDNDGYLDIMTGTEDLYFTGNGDGTFDEVTGLFPAPKSMLSFAFGDLNGDGFEDVYASYGNAYVDGDPSAPDRLWLNTPNGNHYLNVNLKGVVSNEDAIGAKVKIWGPWGIQVREVRSGESYGIVNTGTCHFGLGANTMVDSMVVQWPSGEVDTYTDIDADQGLTLLEGICIAPIAEITTVGAPVVCSGGTPLTLTANPGYQYMWSTLEGTQSIDVNQGGTYTVTIDDGTGCTGEASITVTENPDETPTVTSNGETVFCEGGSVELTSSAASGYTWSNGDFTQSIEVTTAGSYTVAIEGVCGTFTSDAVDVQVLTIPPAPTTTGALILVPGTADITATGTAITWYDAATGGNEVGTGSPFTTPSVSVTTSFWAEDVNQFQGGTSYGGATDNTTSGQYHQNDGFYLYFDAFERFTIRSVKVYSDEVGVRTIAVVDESTGLTVASVSPNIPTGTSRVQLDLEVLVPGSYSLRCIGTPDMWRDGMGSNPAYPFALGTVGSITSSNAGGTNALEYYYFFYDWEVERWGVTCASPRTEAVVTVSGTGINEASNGQILSLQPNPTDDIVVLSFSTNATRVNVEVLDMTGRVVLIPASTNAVSGRLTMDVSALASGQYMVRAVVDDHSQVLPLIVR